jgi:hypothetical protein
MFLNPSQVPADNPLDALLVGIDWPQNSLGIADRWTAFRQQLGQREGRHGRESLKCRSKAHGFSNERQVLRAPRIPGPLPREKRPGKEVGTSLRGHSSIDPSNRPTLARDTTRYSGPSSGYFCHIAYPVTLGQMPWTYPTSHPSLTVLHHLTRATSGATLQRINSVEEALCARRLLHDACNQLP